MFKPQIRALLRKFSTSTRRSIHEVIPTIDKPCKKTTHLEHYPAIKFWRYVFFFAAIPAIALIKLNIELFEDHHPPRPEYREYEYLRKRTKPFPWGDGNHTLFHNPYYNALPEIGYETPEHEPEVKETKNH